jgi:3-oxoacyl-[acyl-carrier protein] reductase
MDLGIRGRKAICAGASVGMGNQAAWALAREGVDLVVSARGEERLKAAADRIARETGVSVTPVCADHSTAEGRAKLAAACPEPDILVITCSPPRATESYLDIAEADWQSAFATGVIGPIELMRAMVPGMADRRFGRVVNIATVAAKNPSEMRMLSGVPRAALVNYTVALSKVVAKDNVVINNVLPGMFHTDATHRTLNERAAANGTSYETEAASLTKRFRIPARRFGDAAEAGALVAMLCSNFASYVVGQNLVIDGGITNVTF